MEGKAKELVECRFQLDRLKEEHGKDTKVIEELNQKVASKDQALNEF